MKNFKLQTLCILFIGTLFSCSNDNDAILFENAKMAKARFLEPEEYLNITYKGKTYENVPTSYDENGDFVFLDVEFASIYNTELKYDFNWSISAKDSQNITFYGSLE